MTNMPVLPEDMWLKLLTYLSLDDRKSIRLTCRSFYQGCNSSLIQNQEEFLLCGNVGEAALQSLSATDRQLWNIKLYRIHLVVPSVTLFENQGANIRSVSFKHCKMDPGIFRTIILHCQTLHSLTLVCKHLTKNRFDDFEALQSRV